MFPIVVVVCDDLHGDRGVGSVTFYGRRKRGGEGREACVCVCVCGYRAEQSRAEQRIHEACGNKSFFTAGQGCTATHPTRLCRYRCFAKITLYHHLFIPQALSLTFHIVHSPRPFPNMVSPNPIPAQPISFHAYNCESCFKSKMFLGLSYVDPDSDAWTPVSPVFSALAA